MIVRTIHATGPDTSEAVANADTDDAMRARTMIPMPELEIAYEGQNTWNIENYRSLSKKERGPTFEVGGHPWYVGSRCRLRTSQHM